MADSEPAKPRDIAVFWSRRDSHCDGCDADLGRGSTIRLDGDKAFCLACADMEHLWFLPSGDTALTRRAREHSRLSAVVLQWSRSRRRYERQGVLVEPEALAQAEEECLADDQIWEMSEAGIGQVVISDDLDELMLLSDRIMVMHGGRVAGIFKGTSLARPQLLEAITTGQLSSAAA